MKRILVSNDDGVHAPGIKALVEAVSPLGEATVIAPLNEQSASSHALTLHQPLRIKEIAPRTMAVDGTPTDCVLLAVREFLDHRPDIVVSGVNQGPNMGEDVLYSGTVAAAMEGALLGIGSVAFSLASWDFRDFTGAVRVASLVVRKLLESNLPPRFLINVNIPPVPVEEIRGIRITRLGTRVYNDAIVRKVDPRGRPYYWIGGSAPTWEPAPDTDFAAIDENFVSITPLILDITDLRAQEHLRSLEFTWG